MHFTLSFLLRVIFVLDYVLLCPWPFTIRTHQRALFADTISPFFRITSTCVIRTFFESYLSLKIGSLYIPVSFSFSFSKIFKCYFEFWKHVRGSQDVLPEQFWALRWFPLTFYYPPASSHLVSIMGWILSPPKKMCWSPKPQYLRM